MANKVLVSEFDGTPAQITFGDVETDFNPTAANDLRHASAADTEVQLDLTDLADGAARESDKVDLGAERATEYNVRCAFEMAATPTVGDLIELYWAPSHHATAATGNPAGATGSDAAYTGYGTLADAVPQLQFIGVFVCDDATTTTVQVGEVGTFSPTERYGILIVKNESGAAFHSDAVEHHVVFDPIVSEIQ